MRSFNPEGQAFHRSETRLPEAQEALYDLLVPETKDNAIDIGEFADLYGADTIKRDKAFVEKMEQKFAGGEATEVSGKFGELFEAIIDNQIEEGDLMGGSASVIVPSRYDDIANGVDSIVEFEKEGATSHIALAIDVTESPQSLSKKFDAVKDSITKGTLSKVKYFKSKNFRGELKPVPRVIIGAGHETVENISHMLIRFSRMKNTIAENRQKKDDSLFAKTMGQDFAKLRRELSSHPLHRMVLEEIREQLVVFHSHAEKLNKSNIAEEYAKILRVVDEIIEEKGLVPDDEETTKLRKDPIYSMILEKVRSFNN